MATEERHITRIEKTEALFRANGDHGQSAILTDQNEEWVYYNDDKSLLYYVAYQKSWDSAAWAYLNNDFGQVTLHDDLLVDEYIKRSTGTDDFIRFENDKISVDAGGTTAFTFEDDKVYTELNAGFGKTTLEAWLNTQSAVQIGGLAALWTTTAEGESNVVNFGNNIYIDSGGYKRMVSSKTEHYRMGDGNHLWYADATGVADDAFTPTMRMILTSADLSTDSVQLGLKTSTPLLNVGSAAGDYTGDGLHILSDIINKRQAFCIIEGDATATNGGWDHGAASLILAQNSVGGASADKKIFEIQWIEGSCYFRAIDDDLSLGLDYLRFLDDGGAGKWYSEVLKTTQSHHDNYTPLYIDTDTGEIYSLTPS